MIHPFVRKLLDRFGGPVISILIHGVVLIVLIHVVVFQTLENSREIEVQITEVEELPEFEEVLESLDELPPDDQLMATDEPESLPDTPPEDFSADSMELAGLAVSAADSPLVMKGLFAGRTAGARADRLEQFAGGYGEQVEASVRRALVWIAGQQLPDGHWGQAWKSKLETKQRAVRLTSLCLLAFLAHGETPQSVEFGDVVQQAIHFLRHQQDPETGLFVPLANKRPAKGGEDLGVYAHAQATYALAEAYALTRAPALKKGVERGLQVMIDGQLESGAWGNWYQQNISDSSATSWQVQAFKAAVAAGIRMDGLEATLERAVNGVAYLYKGDGVWYYRKGPPIKTWKSGGPIMSGAMVLSLQLLGLPNDPMVLAGLQSLNDFGVTEWDSAWAHPINKSLPATYEWYYNTQAVFQRGGSRWKTWNSDFAPMLLNHQNQEGWWLGIGQVSEEEKIYSTSLCTLALQVYYRILPTFQRMEKKSPKVIFEGDVMVTIL